MNRNRWLPFVLIGLGALLLAVNVGALRWGALFGLLQLWPVALVAIGVDLLLGGRHRPIVAVVAVVAGALLYGGLVRPAGGLGGELVELSQPLDGARRAVVRLDVPVSRLDIGALDGGPLLLEGAVRTGRNETLRQAARRDGEELRFELATEQTAGPTFGGNERRVWELRLSPDLPIDLGIDSGVGQARLDLSALELSRFELDAGVGEVTVTLAARGRYPADIDTGVGATTIRLPRGLAARVEASAGLGGVSIRGDLQGLGNDVWQSPDFATAQNRVVLRVRGGVGAITVLGP